VPLIRDFLPKQVKQDQEKPANQQIHLEMAVTLEVVVVMAIYFMREIKLYFIHT